MTVSHTHKLLLTSLLITAGVATLLAQPGPGGGTGGGGKGKANGDKPGRGPGLIAQMSTFRTDVPAHPYNIVLVRPTANSITVSVVCNSDSAGFVEYAPLDGPDPKAVVYTNHTTTQALPKGEPVLFVLEGLKADTAYSYRLRVKETESAGTANASPGGKPANKPTPKPDAFASSEAYSFHTPRAPGKTGNDFTFTIQADSHLDGNVTPEVYLKALANALASKPDFHVDLGDTFMTDKRREFKDALPQYIAQRYYFGQLCHSAPLFMVLGNHDGEYGYAAKGADAIAGWSFAQRTRLFPSPEILGKAGGMYTGRTAMADGLGANYYAFEWGDAMIVALDPFWPTVSKMRGGGGGEGETTLTDSSWSLTLGREQYDWLDRTLAASNARFKFVFIHHLVGGLGKAVRGGVESAPYFEWGGKNADGSDGFAAHRPGWPMPIHQLLVKRNVAAVFHGHDHLYVHSELDGLSYQCVPQPGNPRGGTRSAAEYGYTSGTILGSPGHLRVTVSPAAAKVAFIRSATSDAAQSRRAGDEGNGAVVAEYEIAAKPRR